MESSWNPNDKGRKEERTKTKQKGIDIWRETGLRYCGYANEIGEAFRPLVRLQYVYLSYGIAFTYAAVSIVI